MVPLLLSYPLKNGLHNIQGVEGNMNNTVVKEGFTEIVELN